ncbi:AAA family ATPase [Vibrio vulnificus]|uniref:AAA family ATPase n=1 Tax=Vibrio vulnificus TaxID=672 RepID=UPI003D9CA673
MKSINQLWTMRVIAIWFSNTNLVFTAERVEGHDADPDTGHKDKLYVVKAPKDSNSIPLSKGQLWKVTGDYEGAPENLNFRSGKIRKRYTIRAINMRCLMPNTGEEFKRYVSESPDFKGIGAQKAEVIWSKLGKDVFRYAYENDLSKFDFLTPKIAKLFIKCCKQYSTLEHAEWLRECGFKTSTINKIVTFHGIDSIKAIKANPYIAITLGMSFNEIDALAQNPKTFNITSQCDERRLVAALEYVVQKELEKGHTVSDEKILYKSLRSLLKNQSLAFESLRLVHKASQVRKSEFGFHATAPLIMEHFIAVELLHLKSQASSWSSEMERAFNLAQKDLPFELTAKQKEAVKTGMSSGVFILTGGAGTGKTTVLRVLFKALNQNGYKVYPMALAGRAAECIRAATGYLSQTIHGALMKGDMKAGDKSVVVIDEASMVDISLLFRLLRKIPENTRIIFVGDPYQLPPIGYGLALHDFIKAKCLPTVELDIVKRSSEDSGIPEYTKLIRHGLTPADLTMGNVTFYNTPRQLFSKKAVELMAEACGNATVVAGSNTRVTEINRATQFSINPHGAPILESEEGDFVGDCKITLRKGDPVVFNKNFWDEGVQNGTMGVLDSVSRVNDIFGEVTLLDGSKVAITEPLLQSLSASYCITVHKAQGSQFDRVVVVVDTSRIVDRSWIYTALTRAKNKVDIISTEEIFTEAIKAHPTFQKRRTFLWYLLNNPDFKTMP